jgi:hypothetical protein
VDSSTDVGWGTGNSLLGVSVVGFGVAFTDVTTTSAAGESAFVLGFDLRYTGVHHFFDEEGGEGLVGGELDGAF